MSADTSAAAAVPSEAWYWPMSARTAHYYRRGRSLCRRYELADGYNHAPARARAGLVGAAKCAECDRRKRREAPPAGGGE